jgi:quercetin dioxygenase-like cupin family protein
MPVINLADVPYETFRDGVTYQTLVGDDRGSTPVRIGKQRTNPGSKTPKHSHPYLEVLTVLEGHGEAWMEDAENLVSLAPGVTLVLPPNLKHWFRATGEAPLITYGMHASPRRIVNLHEA